MDKLKIIHISSEVDPFSKTGGLADVARSLPKATKRLGHEVAVVTPFYGEIIDKEKHDIKLIKDNVKIKINYRESIKVSFWKGYLMEDLPVYFIENKKYFSRRKKLYGSAHENVRFLVFDLACLELMMFLDHKPDVIHCHDWQAGLVPYFIKNNKIYNKFFKKSKTLFTIHNLVFQMGNNWWGVPLSKKDYGRRKIPKIADPDIEHINFSKRAILTADAINTVSEKHREEIMTKKFGQDLDRILRNREDRLFGIVNGIDYNAYNPQKDPGLFKNYNYEQTDLKKLNKSYLQKKFALALDDKVPLIVMTSRIAYQKGYELICNIIDDLLKLDVQFVFMGDGDKKYISKLKKLQRKYSKKMVWKKFNQNDEIMLYAGADFMLLPSHHEPCGINQLIAMRYGCVPIVRRVGGLVDTVQNFNPTTGKGTGIVFRSFDNLSLYGAIIRAIETYKYKDYFNDIVTRIMQESSSWEIPAKKYVTLYKKVIKLNGKK